MSSSNLALSAVMIVLDEEAHLDGCLQSLHELVDEVVVLVDDRTTDRSREIASSHGARVFPFRWKGSFSRAQNLALDRVRTDWVLYLDPDERLQPGKSGLLREALTDPETLGVRLLLRPRAGWTRMWLLRVFRNDPRIRFSGISHGQVSRSVRRLVAMQAGRVRDVPLSMEHLGYEGALEMEKALARRSLDEAGLKAAPEDSYLWRNLAVSHLYLGDRDGAWRAWRRSLELIRKEMETNPAQALTYYDMIQNLLEAGEDPLELVEEMTLRFPDYPTSLWLRARCWMGRGQFSASIPLLQRLVEMGRTREFDRSLSHDARVFERFAWGGLGTCLFQAGKFKEAEEYFRLALAEEPESLELRLKAELCSRRAMLSATRPGEAQV